MKLGLKSTAALLEPGTDDDTSDVGSFHVILSTPEEDRDGENLPAEEWERPLPGHIPFDVDHEMTVMSTVGSGVPTIEDDGLMHVRGTYSALPHAQAVRQLVREGHIRTTSVTFMAKRGADGTTVRELLNGTFTPIPSNRGAVVLEAKGAKAAGDARRVQAIHDHAAAMGAACPGGKAARAKATGADGHDGLDAAALAQATDSALDHACELLADVDPTDLPATVQEAIALVQAAGASVDELLDAMGLPDPDDMDDESAAADPDAPDDMSGASKSAAADEELTSARQRLRTLALGALRETTEYQRGDQ